MTAPGYLMVKLVELLADPPVFVSVIDLAAGRSRWGFSECI
jgi:hypothetical protein